MYLVLVVLLFGTTWRNVRCKVLVRILIKVWLSHLHLHVRLLRNPPQSLTTPQTGTSNPSTLPPGGQNDRIVLDLGKNVDSTT